MSAESTTTALYEVLADIGNGKYYLKCLKEFRLIWESTENKKKE